MTASPFVRIDTPAQLNRTVKNICDILRRDKAKGARLYVPELTWMLFLSAIDWIEEERQRREAALGLTSSYGSVIAEPYRWRDWAAPYPRNLSAAEAQEHHDRGWRRRLFDEEPMGAYLSFVNDDLFPYLKNLRDKPGASDTQKVVSEIFRTKESTIVASETNLKEVLTDIDNLTQAKIAEQHMFPISQAFEGLLPALGEKKNDGGQFFTPREVVRAVVRTIQPTVGKTVYDPCCGTGGFLIESYRSMMEKSPTPVQIDFLRRGALWGREDASEAIPICLANMVLHDIQTPRLWHGNTLTGAATYGELFDGAPVQFDYVVTNPPFGSKEGKEAQSAFAYKTSRAQVLFLQHIIDVLADGGRCGMVIDEGVLFHTSTAAFRQTKRKLLSECDLWAVVSLPPNVFVNAGAGSKTNLLFFDKGRSTQRIWYYDLSNEHVTKRKPLTLSQFEDFFSRVVLDSDDPGRISERSWWRSVEDVREQSYDLRAQNPNEPDSTDHRSVADLVTIIRDSQQDLTVALQEILTSER
jgi:type I restriction enzyme M protein